MMSETAGVTAEVHPEAMVPRAAWLSDMDWHVAPGERPRKAGFTSPRRRP
jgi:hypothetical protein